MPVTIHPSLIDKILNWGFAETTTVINSMPKKIKIIDKKLGRERAAWQAFMGENLIEIDPRQDNKNYLLTLVHELTHVCFPDLSEEEVIRCEKIIGNALWEQNYRKVMN